MQSSDVTIKKDAIGNTIITGDGNIVVFQSRHQLESESCTEGSELGQNPYKGLDAFTELDANRFFGREKLIERLVLHFNTMLRSNNNNTSVSRVLPLFGPSGCGKSSLLRAGLIPELTKKLVPSKNDFNVVFSTPGSTPIRSLSQVIANNLFSPEDAQQLERLIWTDNEEGNFDGLHNIIEEIAEVQNKPIVIVIDQFEELYTMNTDNNETSCFIANLLYATTSHQGNTFLMFAMRSDFLLQTQMHQEINHLISKQGFFVPTMNSEELCIAIRMPAREAGFEFSESTVELLLNQTEGRDGALPLLQFALTRIWDGLISNKNSEPAEILKKIGGVGGALAYEAQSLYISLSEKEQDIAKHLFLSLVHIGEGTKDTRRRVELNTLLSHSVEQESIQTVIRYFSQQNFRLISLAGSKDGVVTVELTHESLIENWDMLRMWIDENRSNIRFHRQFEVAVAQWRNQGKTTGLLWRASALENLKAHFEIFIDNFTLEQVQFYQASLELKKRQKKNSLLIAGVTMLLILLAVASNIGSSIFANNLADDIVKQNTETFGIFFSNVSTIPLLSEDWITLDTFISEVNARIIEVDNSYIKRFSITDRGGIIRGDSVTSSVGQLASLNGLIEGIDYVEVPVLFQNVEVGKLYLYVDYAIILDGFKQLTNFVFFSIFLLLAATIAAIVFIFKLFR